MSGVIPDMFLTENLPIERYAAEGHPDRPLRADRQRLRADARELRPPDHSGLRDRWQALRAARELHGPDCTFGLSKVVDGYDVWNVAAVQDAMTKLQEDAYVFNYYTTQLSVMSTCISNNLSAFVNWQTGECSFDSESFIRC